MQLFTGRDNVVIERDEYPLEDLSEQLNISMQTLVRWSDRHLIDASLAWTLTEDNEEVRVIRLRKGKLTDIKEFVEEYRAGHVSRTEARRILKMIDRKRVKKMVRAGDIETVTIDEETKVNVGSIEDYLMSVEHERGDDSE